MVDRQFEEMQREIREIRRNMSGVDTQIEELQGQYALMEDRITMSAQTQALPNYYSQNRTLAPQDLTGYLHDPALPVVNLSPHASANQSEMREDRVDMSDPGVLKYKTIDETGRVIEMEKPTSVSRQELAEASAVATRVAQTVPAPDVEAPAPSTHLTAAPVDDGKDDATRLYESGFSYFRKGELDEARKTFKEFVKIYPDHDLADNAIYWWAECRYHRRDFLRSLHLFQRILEEHPMGNKVPDAMLKMGLCLINLGQKEEGVGILEQVAALYPTTPAALVAERRRAAFSSTE
jgi:tol-pal system protein YbgF